MLEAKRVPGLKNYSFVQVEGKNCMLGFGAYGSVQLGKNTSTGQTVAIKKINRKLAYSEVEVHMKLNHPNIIKMLDFSLDENNHCSYIVLEYAENGTLFDCIRSNGIKDKRMARGIFLGVCDAIDYLHSHNIMHRDIKPENILLDHKNDVKLCDFGFAVACEPRMTICGTPEYMAPQMIMGKQYNHKIDVWCTGILLYEMIEGRAPFVAHSIQEMYEKMKKPVQFSNNFSSEEKQLIKNILKMNPSERPQIKEIINNQNPSEVRKIQEIGRVSTVESETQFNIKILQAKQQTEKPEKRIKLIEVRDIEPCQCEEKRIKILEVRDLDPQKIRKSSSKNNGLFVKNYEYFGENNYSKPLKTDRTGIVSTNKISLKKHAKKN